MLADLLGSRSRAASTAPDSARDANYPVRRSEAVAPCLTDERERRGLPLLRYFSECEVMARVRHGIPVTVVTARPSRQT